MHIINSCTLSVTNFFKYQGTELLQNMLNINNLPSHTSTIMVKIYAKLIQIHAILINVEVKHMFKTKLKSVKL